MCIYFIVGTFFGSFITAAVYRIPRKLGLVWQRSSCPNCSHQLAVIDLFPLVSYIFNRGRCRYCSKKIALLYPIIEVVAGICLALLYHRMGICWHLGTSFVLTICLLIIFFIDLEHYIIPDSMQLLLLISTLLDRFLGQHIDSKEACMHGVLGATVLLVAITILRVTISAIKKTEALGLGDMKMLAIIGFYIGLYKLPIYLCLSGIFGIVTAFIWKILRRGNKFPFAPSLCLAAFVQLFLPKIENLMDFIALMS